MPSVCSGSELAEELEELEELDEEELDELAELEAGELLGWLVEFEGAGAPPPPPPQPVIRLAAMISISKIEINLFCFINMQCAGIWIANA